MAEPIDGVCKILCGENVQRIVLCRPGVEFDSPPAMNSEHIMYDPSHGWISFVFGASMRLGIGHRLSFSDKELSYNIPVIDSETRRSVRFRNSTHG